MYHNVDESLKGCSRDHEREKEGPEKLLEEIWFFRNLLLDNKTRMLNYTTTNSTSESDDNKENLHIGKSYEEIFKSIKSMSSGSSSTPPWTSERKEFISSSSKLARGPSMPLGKGGSDDHQEFEEDEEEVEFSMGKLIRQASLNSNTTSKSMPLTSKHVPKSLTTSSSNISRRKSEFDSLKLERMKPRRLILNQLKPQKSLSALECKQLRVIPEFQEKKRREEEEDNDDDDDHEEKNPIKAQIKFWARAVASNVRQE